MEINKLIDLIDKHNFQIIFSGFTNSTFNYILPVIKKKYSKIKIISHFHHGYDQNHNLYDKVVTLMTNIKVKSNNKISIHPGIEFSQYPLKQFNKTKEITFVGRLWERKNCEDLIKAFLCNELKSYKLNIIGSGDELESLTQIAEGNKNIIFHGDINDKEKFKVLGRSSLFVAPSFDEGFGIVYIEALYSGTPVIGFSKSRLYPIFL